MTRREFKYHQHKKQLKHRYFDWDIPEKRSPNDRICENEGCSHRATVKCVLDYHDEETNEWKEDVEWLCYEHAEDAGYCMGCGTFIAGTGMEYRNNGYCDNCWDEIKSSEYEDDEDFYNGSLDY